MRSESHRVKIILDRNAFKTEMYFFKLKHGKRVQNFSYKMIKVWGSNVKHGNYS